MALRSDELQFNLQHLNGMLTTHEAAKQLDLSYWHFMHLVEAGRIPGVRVVDRWLFSLTSLNDYRRSRYGELEDLARMAIEHPAIILTEKQALICHYLVNGERPSEIARKLQQSRQSIHSQVTLIREKVTRRKAIEAPPPTVLNPTKPTRTRRGGRKTPHSQENTSPLIPPEAM
ncbi:MAG TPA: helix-turn-helix domain-containing protein [Ktedonobacteraceae bacterium]|nr:helix-turn-helix domain-containing protein [Ktedonobacteraceae bacterium]